MLVDIESDQFEAKVDSQLLNDLRALIINYDIMVFPTASKLMEMILITAANIAGFNLDKKEDRPIAVKDFRPTTKRMERIDEFLQTAELQILRNRPSHLGAIPTFVQPGIKLIKKL